MPETKQPEGESQELARAEGAYLRLLARISSQSHFRRSIPDPVARIQEVLDELRIIRKDLADRKVLANVFRRITEGKGTAPTHLSGKRDGDALGYRRSISGGTRKTRQFYVDYGGKSGKDKD